MRYATWKIAFDKNATEGTFPEEFRAAFTIDTYALAGYIPDNAQIAEFTKWEAQEITSEQILQLAKARNKDAKMVDGYIVMPAPIF